MTGELDELTTAEWRLLRRMVYSPDKAPPGASMALIARVLLLLARKDALRGGAE